VSKRLNEMFSTVYPYTCSKNDVILSVRKHYSALGLELIKVRISVRVGVRILGLRLGLAEIRFWVKRIFEQL